MTYFDDHPPRYWMTKWEWGRWITACTRHNGQLLFKKLLDAWGPDQCHLIYPKRDTLPPFKECDD